MSHVTAEDELLYCYNECSEDLESREWPCYKKATSLLFLRLAHGKYGDKDHCLRCRTGGIVYERRD